MTAEGGRDLPGRMRVRTSPLLVAGSWGAGVGLGVAAGAYLSAVGGSGAPGVASLDAYETLQLPVITAVVVTGVVYLCIHVFRFASRIRSPQKPDSAE